MNLPLGGGGGEHALIVMHGRSRMTIDPFIPSISGRRGTKLDQYRNMGERIIAHLLAHSPIIENSDRVGGGSVRFQELQKHR